MGNTGMVKVVDADADQKSVAEVFLVALMDNGIEYVFANGGTDFAPIIEALVSATQAGEKTPKFITVPHENVAMAMAEGYFRLAGKPAGVMVHVTVGTANTICGVMNASRDNVPVLVMAGRTPLTESGDIGSRNIGIHWGQENFDQGGMLREYVKWDYELREGQPVETLIGRALDIAMSEPCGPVYLTLPREVLGHTVGEFEWQFSVGSILAIFHDVLITIGLFSFLSLEINLSIVAAVLTIVGYSMNDTVVIYDRIRENLSKFSSSKIEEITNTSINETLSRTIITSLTTLLALISIFVLGGEILRGFALAMIIGVIIGTYSSIFVASPILKYLNVSYKTIAKDQENN